MTTITVRASVTQSEKLTRRQLDSDLVAFWASVNGVTKRVDEVSPATTVLLGPGTTLIVVAPSDATVVVGWTPVSGPSVELAVNQLAILSLPLGATAYVKNNGTAITEVRTIFVR